MNCGGRKRKSRNIDVDHSNLSFKPCGLRKDSLDVVIIFEDEIEAIRLADYESLYQQECANMMEISRTTFSRLVESARKKIADALLNKKVLTVETRR